MKKDQKRLLKTPDLCYNIVKAERHASTECAVEGCISPVYKHGLCQYHRSLQQARREKALELGDNYHPVPIPPKPVVYAIAGADKIKIGVTANLETRLPTLQTGSPVRLELLACVPGGEKLERRIHKHLDGYRCHGEWFIADGLVLEVVEQMKSGDRGAFDKFLPPA